MHCILNKAQPPIANSRALERGRASEDSRGGILGLFTGQLEASSLTADNGETWTADLLRALLDSQLFPFQVHYQPHDSHKKDFQ